MEATQKWVNLSLLIGGGVVFLFLSRLAELVWDLARVPVPRGWIVQPTTLISFLVAAGGCLVLRSQSRANLYFNEVALELSRVTWPGRKETMASTGVVIVLAGVAAGILFLLDALWGTVARGIL